MGSSEKKQQSSNVSPDSQSEPQTMSSQALKATVQQSVRMASQVVEQQSRHGGGFVWRAGVKFFSSFLCCFFSLLRSSFQSGLVTSTKVDRNNKRRSNGGKCNKGRSGRVNSPKDLDGNISIRVVVLALSFQYCIPLMI